MIINTCLKHAVNNTRENKNTYKNVVNNAREKNQERKNTKTHSKEPARNNMQHTTQKGSRQLKRKGTQTIETKKKW